MNAHVPIQSISSDMILWTAVIFYYSSFIYIYRSKLIKEISPRKLKDEAQFINNYDGDAAVPF